MKKIAIIGACCTRDMYNSRIIPDWKEFADVVYTAFQSSFISIMASPIPYSRDMLSCKEENYDQWCVDILVRELEKNFCNDLLSLQPDNILIDFYSDVVHGIWEINDGESYLSRRPRGEQDNYIVFRNLGKKKVIDPIENYDIFMPLWKEGIDNFINFCEKELPQTKLIVNRPYFNDEMLEIDGSISRYDNKYVERYNKIYSDMVNYILSYKDNILVADLKKRYYLNPNYVFGGVWICHYQNDYYKDLIMYVDSLCVETRNEKKCHNNLLINGNCEHGTLFFKYFSDQFYIAEYNNHKCFEIDINENKKVYAQIISHDIAIEGNSKESYTIKFLCKVHSQRKLSTNAIFIIRTFIKPNKWTKADSLEQYEVKWNGIYDEYCEYSITISPKGKYLSIGLFCEERGHISWKNICVFHGTDSSVDVEENYVSKYLLKGKRMLDYNKLPLYI